LLKKQTNFYTWESFIERLGKENLEKNLEIIKNSSPPKTELYKLMIKGFNTIRIKSSLEESLQYQRLEYAAILSMAGHFSHILYPGDISFAWSYLYSLFSDKKLPIFTRAVIEKKDMQSIVSSTEANYLVKTVTKSAEEILTNENFPPKERRELRDRLFKLVLANSSNIPEEKNNNTPHN
jgi:hypothetical protein